MRSNTHPSRTTSPLLDTTRTYFPENHEEPRKPTANHLNRGYSRDTSPFVFNDANSIAQKRRRAGSPRQWRRAEVCGDGIQFSSADAFGHFQTTLSMLICEGRSSSKLFYGRWLRNRGARAGVEKHISVPRKCEAGVPAGASYYPRVVSLEPTIQR